MEEGKKYVVYGMRLKCDQGTMENYLSTDVGHGVVYQGQPVMNANDHEQGIHLTHFGDCNSKKVFEEAKKEADEKYKAEEGDGFFTKAGKWLAKNATKAAVNIKANLMSNKCEMVTPLPWLFTSEDHTIDGAPALLMESLCPCALGGVISIVPVVEEVVEEEEIDEEAVQLTGKLFSMISQMLSSPESAKSYYKSMVLDLCIQLWGTEMGNRIEKEIFNMVQPFVSPNFAFEYVERPENVIDEDLEYWDYYRTNETYGFQRAFGFMDFYDKLAPYGGMELETEILVFTPEGSDKEYRLQFWKGAYGWGGAFGGEIGLYQRSAEEAEKSPYRNDNIYKETILYECVSGEDEISTKQEIYSKTGDLLIYNNTEDYAEDGKHYWNLAIKTDSGYQAQDLVIKNTLIIEDENMREALIKEIEKNNTLQLIEVKGKEVVIQYGEFKKK